MKRIISVALVLSLLGIGASARADWNPGDPYKMHFPQLPDPQGWDVNMTFPKVLADDFLCIETGPISDIHFWFSFQRDITAPIARIHTSIHDDVPGDPTHPSMPGELLWQRDFFPPQFHLRTYGTGSQGWYDPNTGQFDRPDHQLFYQANIENILDPFVQTAGKIYWLDLSVELAAGTQAHIGWKTSLQHFNDDAVWGDFPPPITWRELFDPITGQSLDMAFVITPEPGSILLVAAGALMALRRQGR